MHDGFDMTFTLNGSGSYSTRTGRVARIPKSQPSDVVGGGVPGSRQYLLYSAAVAGSVGHSARPLMILSPPFSGALQAPGAGATISRISKHTPPVILNV